MNFTDRVAIITGAGSPRGFGRCTAKMMAERGCSLAIVDMNEAGARETAAICSGLGVKAIGYQLDVTDEEQIKKVFRQIRDDFGKIDILINLAGITQKVDVPDMTLADWNRIVDTDMTSVFLCCREVLPYLKENGYGRIVNMSSISARKGATFGGAHYCAAKAGIIAFSKSLAKAVALDNITVNCVAPGQSKTDIGGNPYENKPAPLEVPMNRRGEAKEIASVLMFMASEHVSYITGATIDVNGGAYMV